MKRLMKFWIVSSFQIESSRGIKLASENRALDHFPSTHIQQANTKTFNFVLIKFGARELKKQSATG